MGGGRGGVHLRFPQGVENDRGWSDRRSNGWSVVYVACYRVKLEKGLRVQKVNEQGWKHDEQMRLRWAGATKVADCLFHGSKNILSTSNHKC